MKKDRCKICKEDRGYVNIRGRGSVGGWVRVSCPCVSKTTFEEVFFGRVTEHVSEPDS